MCWSAWRDLSLNRKSQRYYRLKFADTYYGEMTHYGLYRLAWADVRRARIDRKKNAYNMRLTIKEREESMATGKALDGKPYAGNPHVRFDEGKSHTRRQRRGVGLYSTKER